MAGLDTLTNVREAWTIDDLYDAHEALDIKEEVEREAYERSQK